MLFLSPAAGCLALALGHSEAFLVSLAGGACVRVACFVAGIRVRTLYQKLKFE